MPAPEPEQLPLSEQIGELALQAEEAASGYAEEAQALDPEDEAATDALLHQIAARARAKSLREAQDLARDRERQEQPHDDPRKLGGEIIDPLGEGAEAQGTIMFDARRALLVEAHEVAIAHPTREGKPAPDVVAIEAKGRINRPPNVSGDLPAERIEILQLMSWAAAAELVANLQALADRGRTGQAG
jgi:hypothetical protein